ncbi:Hypothetical predicted protein [Octopus vulgaris]|uniref:Uncharacterized protein n=1 Tax=Octopus vulgaris TaxID=6645 RepID=A0AA36BJH9_OCTVU|nr:Hypothetical predicted protein [Octopus vulgaris]
MESVMVLTLMVQVLVMMLLLVCFVGAVVDGGIVVAGVAVGCVGGGGLIDYVGNGGASGCIGDRTCDSIGGDYAGVEKSSRFGAFLAPNWLGMKFNIGEAFKNFTGFGNPCGAYPLPKMLLVLNELIRI